MLPIILRPATLDDVPTLERWDVEPDVIAATTSAADAEQAFGDHDWRLELAQQSAVSYFLIAERDTRPVGALQICDPREEPTHYWGEIEAHLRAIDIWIGDAADRGRGYGAVMMELAHARCFADPLVTAIVIDPLASNTRAIAFYRRLGYEPVGRQMFGDDDCYVHKLARADWERRLQSD
ncbi:MAG: family N-acetyltransferase [Myxococcaceae bacterium]|nr:family N-acetyltransferase [Myxococcaceae bacterium]